MDRVELAYLRHLLSLDHPIFGLARTRLGYVLLDRAGMAQLLARLEGRTPWGAPDRLSKISRNLSEARRRCESDLRRLAMARCLPARLSHMLHRHLPAELTYFNVGHSNLTDRVLSAVSQATNTQVGVFIHDTIPLDYPIYQRPGTVDKFARMLKRVAVWADWIICNSHQTARDLERHLSADQFTAQTLVAHLGIDLSKPGMDWPKPPGFDLDRPYFVTLGTIEPRKNHALLLNLWQELAKDRMSPMPQLLICGARGWQNEAVFARLDTDPQMGVDIFELPGLHDEEVACALQSSAGLLFPSYAEGFGLPAVEAAALGVPVLCGNLPVFREFLYDFPFYAPIEQLYAWKVQIVEMVADRQAGRTKQPLAPPNWDTHFQNVLERMK